MRPAVLCLIVSVLCAVLIQDASAEVQTFDAPRSMSECYWWMKRKTTLKKTEGVAIQFYCESLFIIQNIRLLNANRGPHPSALDFFDYLLRTTKYDLLQFNIKRKKRQAPEKHKKKLRIRKEIRMLSEKELHLFFDAINSAKNNKTISPNKYEALTEFHTGMTSLSAHGGCNFHGWHRMYLLMFENALREEGPQYKDLALPYWDSTMDERLEDPELSALFSDRLLGSCRGVAKGGIMRDGWDSSTGEVTRNCKTDGPLMNEGMIKNVTQHYRMAKICGEDSDIDHDLEFWHGGVHRWIDGQMAMLVSSPADPVFWLHHCFIDLIWELFRENQIKHNVDPETDYPLNPVTMGAHELHLPDADLGFAGLKVINGLSNMYTSEWYKYAKRPTCNKGKKDCGSKYLKCVEDKYRPGKGQYVCAARTLAEVEAYEEEQNRPKPKPCPTEPPVVVPPHPGNHTKPVPTPPKEIVPVQNTFCMNGKSDIAQWVYVPVKIILKRPPDYKSYGSYPVRRGKISKVAGDIYSPQAYENIGRYLRKAEAPAKYDNCIEPETPTNTIYVKSTGLNYEGIYKEYAIMDKRLAITVSTAYLAVRKPLGIDDVSVAMFHAHDSCGRVCKPVCKVPGTEIFRPCSGAIKITGKKPYQFGNSFGDAVLDVWDFDSDASCPQLTTNNITVSFYCDYSTDWIWPTAEPMKMKPSPAPTTPTPPPEPTTITAGCSLGYGCVVGRPCGMLHTCQNGEILECLKSCHIYAQCFNNRYMLYQCRRGERYMTGRGCVSSRQNPCDYKNSGLMRRNRNKKNRKANRKAKGRQ